MTLQQKFTQAENLFGNEARKQGVTDDTIEKLISMLSTGKGAHPFMIEAGHHTVKLSESSDALDSIDFDGNPISRNEGIQDSFRLGLLAHHLRTTRGRTAKIIISLSNLHHTQGSPENRKKTELLSGKKEQVGNIVQQFFNGEGKAITLPHEDISLITQSEATRKGRNKIRSLIDQYDGTREKAMKLYEEFGHIILHAVTTDGIEVIIIITQSSINSEDTRVTGGVPLLTRIDAESEWETQCGPTVTVIQHLIIEKVGRNMPEGRIITIDDFSDSGIAIKSARGIHLMNPFLARDMRDKSFILSHENGTPKLLYTNSIPPGDRKKSFDEVLDTESNALIHQGYQTIYLYKERVPIKRGGDSTLGASCDIGLCGIEKP